MDRHSKDPNERIEWQLDQIRQCLIALIALLVIVPLAVGLLYGF